MAAQTPVSRTAVTAVVTFYLVAALAMVMANKWVLNSTAAPTFFVWCQLMIAAALFVIADLLRLLPMKLGFDLAVSIKLVPMIALNVASITLSNLTLKYVDASFYQVARGLVLPFTVLASGLMLHTRPSLLILISCALVSVGFFVGVFLDGTSVSLLGVSFGIASSAVTAVHSNVIKLGLETVKSVCKDDKSAALTLSWYGNMLSALVLLPAFILAGEVPSVVELLFGKEKAFWTFVYGTLITGVIGFLMSIASLLSIQVTSPITHMVSSAVRGVAASLLGIWFFQDVVTAGRATSIAIILGGSMWYTWIKNRETVKARASNYERVPLEEVQTSGSQDQDGLDSGKREA